MSIIIFVTILNLEYIYITGTLSSVNQYIHSSSLWAPEMDGMRKLPNYNEKIAKFLIVIRQFNFLCMSECNKNHHIHTAPATFFNHIC